MNFKYLVFLLLFIQQSALFAQARVKSAHYNFSMEKPKGWFEGDNETVLKNLEKYEINDVNRGKILRNHKGSIVLAVFYKYNPRKHSGLIPTIQVHIRANNTENYSAFYSNMLKSIEQMAAVFENFEVIDGPKTISVDGVNSFYFTATFTMESAAGELIKVRTKTYAIPKSDYFIQVNYTDGPEIEDCSELYNNLLNSIKLD